MKRTITLSAAALLLALTLSACGDKNKDAKPAVLAKVNGQPISGEVLEWLLKEQVPPGTPVDDALRAKGKEHLIQREALMQLAREAKLDKEPNIKMRMEYVRDEQLVAAYLKDWNAKHPVDEATAKADFDKRVAEAGEKEFKARHILVEKEDEAKALIAKLEKGAKFADLAKASKDKGSAAQGGDLGWARPSNYVPEFAEALGKLEKGKFTTTPVKSQFGFHVILLEDSRPAASPDFEAVKGQYIQTMQQDSLKKHIDEVVAKAKVE